MTTSIDWNKDTWNILDSYFNTVSNYLTKNQINSYDTFLTENIPKTIRQFNPIELPYLYNEETDQYKFELKITIGGTLDNGQVVNDGKGIYIGKPIIQEAKQENKKKYH